MRRAFSGPPRSANLVAGRRRFQAVPSPVLLGRPHPPTSRFDAASTCAALSPEHIEALQREFGSGGVLVAGASGRTGKRVVEVLQEAGVPVRAMVRNKEKAANAFSSSSTTAAPFQVVQGDVFKYSSLPGALGEAKAIIVATGNTDPLDPLGAFNCDFQGTLNLVALAKMKGVKKFVLVTSIGTDDLVNLLNLFWGVLFWKKRGEEGLQRSGLDYTIIRPGGLRDKPKEGESEEEGGGAIVMEAAGHFGAPPVLKLGQVMAGSILRKQVAEVCVAALVDPGAKDKVVEIIAKRDAPRRSLSDLFAAVKN